MIEIKEKDTQTKTIGVREFHRNFKKISERASRGASFVIAKNAQPMFRIGPVTTQKEKKYTWKDLEKFEFKGFEKDLSKKVDTILYNL